VPPTLPTMVVIGAQKAGSTWLMQALGDHPAIFMPRGEVPFFEDPDYDWRGLPWLKQQLAGSSGEPVVGIKRPSLLARHEAAPRVARDLEDPRVIAVLRDPVDRAISAYWHTMAGGRIPLRSMNEGLRAILDGRDDATWPAGRTILEWGLYDHHLDVWSGHVPPERTLVLLYDDLKKAPEAMLARSFEFLGVDPSHRPTTVASRPMAGKYSMVRQVFGRTTAPLYMRLSEDRTRRYGRSGPLAPLAMKACRAIDRLVLAPLAPNRKPVLADDVRERLVDYFREDVGRLEARLGRPLDGWLRRPAAGGG